MHIKKNEIKSIINYYNIKKGEREREREKEKKKKNHQNNIDLWLIKLQKSLILFIYLNKWFTIIMASSSNSFDNLDKCTIPINSTHNSKQNGNNSKKKQNYGSLRKDLPIPEQKQIVNINHKLTNGETLQGISLKYDVSVGVPRDRERVNKNYNFYFLRLKI